MDARAKGLLGRDRIDGAILLYPASTIHTMRMRFPLDVAFCDHELRVLDVITMVPNRLSRPRLYVHAVVEAQAQAFLGWGVRAGGQLGIVDGL
jgi:uncharacterized membrane protein (UPF0127 family)